MFSEKAVTSNAEKNNVEPFLKHETSMLPTPNHAGQLTAEGRKENENVGCLKQHSIWPLLQGFFKTAAGTQHIPSYQQLFL